MFTQQNKFIKLSRARLLILVLGLALVAIGIAQRTSLVSSAVSAPAEFSGAVTQEENEAKALLTTIQPYGFEPTEINVTEGRYLLVVQNRSGLSDLMVKLETEDQKTIHEEHAQLQKWRKRFNLKRGVYRLVVENNPEWTCIIRVQ